MQPMQKTPSKPRKTFLTTSLSLGLLAIAGCGSLPPRPHHVQYGVHANINPPGFYGVDSDSKAHIYRAFGDPAMKGAQCLTAADYKAWAAWVQKVKEAAEQRCN